MSKSSTYNYRTLVLIITVISAVVGDMLSQSFSCNNDIYIAQYNDVRKRSDILVLDLENNFSYSILVLDEARHITALGYSVADEYLYALDFETYELLKINSMGQITSLGVPTDLDLSLSYHSGTVNALGTGLRVIGRDVEDNANKYFSINLFTDDHYAGYSSVIANQDISATDIAIDPYRGIMYGYDNRRFEVFVISAGAAVTSNNFSPGELSMSAIFFDKMGKLYGYRSNGDLYSIKKTNGELQKIAELPPAAFADAASCSATYIFTKEVLSQEVLPCDTLTVKYSFINRMGIGQAGLYLNDTFPDGYEIVDIDLNYFYGSSLEMVAPNILSLSNFDFVLDQNDITVKVLVPPSDVENTSWSSSGILESLPEAMGVVAVTDDPVTSDQIDPTSVEITLIENIRLEDYMTNGCDKRSAVVNSPLPYADNLWQDGSTANSYVATESGWVTLLAIDDCNLYSDSIFIEDLPSARFVRITGGEEEYSFGDMLSLSYETNMPEPYTIEWKVDGQLISDKEELNFIADNSHIIVLNLKNSTCETSDIITIGMDQSINTYIPNAFSPNGDGVNDQFVISTSANGTYDLSVYDRWGGLLFDEEGLQLNSIVGSWDGKFNGSRTAENVFIWKVVIHYADGREERATGEVIVYD